MLIFIGLSGEASVIIVESVSSEVVFGAYEIISVSSSISAIIGVVVDVPPPPPPLLLPLPALEDDEQVPQSVAQEEQDSEALQVPSPQHPITENVVVFVIPLFIVSFVNILKVFDPQTEAVNV